MVFNPVPKPNKKKRQKAFKLPSPQPKKKTTNLGRVIITWALVIGFLTGGYLGFNSVRDRLTIAGVPLSIIEKFIRDPIAFQAYWEGDKRLLHERLKQLGVEEEIKAFYRPQIPDEIQLDWYIHQLLYERSGYVGEIYQVNSDGILEFKPQGEQRLREELNRNHLLNY